MHQGNFVLPGAVWPIELLSHVIHWFPGILGISPTIYNPYYPSMPCHNWVCSISLTVCEMEHQSLLIQDHWPTMNGNRIIWDSWVNTMAANALAPFILRSSVIVLLKMYDEWVFLVSYKKDFNYLYSLHVKTWQMQMYLFVHGIKAHIKDKYLKYFLGNRSEVNVTSPHLPLVNIGSGNGLTLSGNEPLPKPMLTKFFITIWCHQATMA